MHLLPDKIKTEDWNVWRLFYLERKFSAKFSHRSWMNMWVKATQKHCRRRRRRKRRELFACMLASALHFLTWLLPSRSSSISLFLSGSLHRAWRGESQSKTNSTWLYPRRKPGHACALFSILQQTKSFVWIPESGLKPWLCHSTTEEEKCTAMTCDTAILPVLRRILFSPDGVHKGRLLV